MKTILAITSIFLGIIFSEDGPSSEIVNFKLPKNAKQIEQKEFASTINHSYFFANDIKDYKNKYRVEDVLLGFEDKIIEGNISFTDVKRKVTGELEENMSKGLKVSVLTFNQREFIVVRKTKNSDGYIRFNSEIQNKKWLQGTIAYDNNSKELADKVLNEFLSSITFK
jgi:hypothetical protein